MKTLVNSKNVLVTPPLLVNTSSDVKLFVDGALLFAVIHDVDFSTATLNNYLVKIQDVFKED